MSRQYNKTSYLLGCKVEIWKHRIKGDPHFTCDGTNDEIDCHSYDLGSVGNQKTSSIKCTCPKEFDYIEYDIPRHDWTLFVDGQTQIEIDTLVVTNTCNPDIAGPNGCTDMSESSSKVGFQINCSIITSRI